MKAAQYFSEADKQLVLQAIADAEKNSSGEIRVHLEAKCTEDVMDRAAYIFEKLKMHETKLRNGVLFYIAFDSRKFAILGDAGINAVTGEDFWEEEKKLMLEGFSSGNHAGGLANAIALAGEKLKEHFPWQEDDINELPDDISFGDSEPGNNSSKEDNDEGKEKEEEK